jgi:putative tricarboxylic transport membrane protein
VPAVIGLFALSQAFALAEAGGSISQTGKVDTKGVWDGALEPFRKWKVTLRSALIGIVLGTTPGIGIATANVLAYTEAVRASKDPESFGKGNIEGVIAPETANNAVEGGSLIPALTLGIPGGATAAIFLGALNLYGIQTGFKLYTANSTALYGLILAMLFGTLMFVIIGLTTIPFLTKLTVIKNEILVPVILVMCVLGAYTLRGDFGDVWLCLIMGVVGFLMNKMHFPTVPMVISLVLGPIAEQGFNRAMLITNWSYRIFIERPIPLILLLLGVLIFGSPLYAWLKQRKQTQTAE